MRILCTLLGLWLSVVPVVAQSLVVRNGNGEVIGPLYADKLAVKVPASLWQHWNADDQTPQIDRVILLPIVRTYGSSVVTLGQDDPPPTEFLRPDAYYETGNCTGSAYVVDVKAITTPTWLIPVVLNRSGYAWYGGDAFETRTIATVWAAGQCKSIGTLPRAVVVAPVQYVRLSDLPILASPLSVDIVPVTAVSAQIME